MSRGHGVLAYCICSSKKDATSTLKSCPASQINMNHRRATIFGFLAASIVPAAYLAVAAPLGGQRNLPSIFGTFFVLYYFSFLAAGVLGVPAFLALNKYKLVAWWSAIGTGLLVGPLAPVVATSLGSSNPENLLRFSAIGGVAGFAFWIFWRLGRT